MMIEISDPLAAALMLRANQIREKEKGEAVKDHGEALLVVLKDNDRFEKLYAQMGNAWPGKATA